MQTLVHDCKRTSMRPRMHARHGMAQHGTEPIETERNGSAAQRRSGPRSTASRCIARLHAGEESSVHILLGRQRRTNPTAPWTNGRIPCGTHTCVCEPAWRHKHTHGFVALYRAELLGSSHTLQVRTRQFQGTACDPHTEPEPGPKVLPLVLPGDIVMALHRLHSYWLWRYISLVMVLYSHGSKVLQLFLPGTCA